MPMRAVISRKIDSPGKKVALYLWGVVFLGIIIAFLYAQASAVRHLQQLEASDVVEVKIAGKKYKDNATINLIVSDLHQANSYSLGNEGCIHAYQMQIMLSSGESLFYAIGKNRKGNTMLIQPTDESIPSCLTGVILSSESLLYTIQHLH